MMERLQFSQGQQNTRQEDAQTFKQENPTGVASATAVPAQLYKNITDAQNTYGGVMSKLGRMVGMNGGYTQLQSALTAALDRKGTLQEVDEVAGRLAGVAGNTVDEKIANSGIASLQQLDPYERQYLQLKMGVK